MPENNKSGLYITLIVIVSFFAFFINNHIVPADLMESRNLATAQEMVRTGNYLVPTMNGELRLEKPPLPTWVAAAIENVTPDNLVAQRCAAGVMATLAAIFLFFLVKRLTKNQNIGLGAALIFATMFNPVMMGRTATWDIYCHSFMLGGIYFMVAGFEERGRQWGRFIVAGIFMGLSFLGKGPVAFYALLLPFLISYILVLRPSAQGKKAPILIMVLTCLAVSLWWPAYLMIFHPDAAVAVADKESSAWVSHGVKPIWYYWKFFTEAGIWALFWITALIFYFTNRQYRKHRRVFLFSIMWAILSLILVSFIPQKKTRYLLPMLIPGAINICFYIWYSMRYAMSKANKVVFRINAMIIALILIALPIYLYIGFVRKGLIGIGMFTTITIISAILCIYIIRSIYGRNGIRIKNVFAGIVLTMIMVEVFCLNAVGQIFINKDRHSIRILREEPLAKGLKLFYDDREFLRMELVYEVDNVIRPMNTSDESQVYSNLPFVFISSLPADSVFEGKKVEITHIGSFDNNWQKKTSRKHNKDLVKEAYVIKAAKYIKPEDTEDVDSQ